jgi:hypothetical protein
MQMWLPGTFRCFWQQGRGKRWFPAVAVKDLGDSFLEVHVESLGRRMGTLDRERDYPGYIRPAPAKRKKSGKA